MTCNLWVTDVFMNYNLEPLKHEHVHAHRYINTTTSRHPNHELTLFHLCRRTQQHPGSAPAYVSLICIRQSAGLSLEKRDVALGYSVWQTVVMFILLL